MTAEVAIMNRLGIALAADSAVTLGSGKVYNTCDKLFALSKYQPVGIMTYSSALLMGIEWETIIKSYRNSLGTKSFDTLSEYAWDFLNYLSKFPYFSDEQMKEYLRRACFDVFSHILTWIISDLHEKFDSKENIEAQEIEAVINNACKDIKVKMKGVDDEKQIKVDESFIDNNMETVNKMIEIVFEKYKPSKKQIADFITILKLNFQKCGWTDNYGGIVIAGYGEREIFPSVHEFKISGKLGNSLIYFGEDIDKIDACNITASICPFAQSDVVYQFVRGMDNDFAEKISAKFDEILDALPELLPAEHIEKTKALGELFAEFIKRTMYDIYVAPILDIVASMEKAELAQMAEAMVNLTALKRHVSTDEETVGGPIDVALITKGDGFIWIKKKTNYDPAINRNLYQSYFRGGRNENI